MRSRASLPAGARRRRQHHDLQDRLWRTILREIYQEKNVAAKAPLTIEEKQPVSWLRREQGRSLAQGWILEVRLALTAGMGPTYEPRAVAQATVAAIGALILPRNSVPAIKTQHVFLQRASFSTFSILQLSQSAPLTLRSFRKSFCLSSKQKTWFQWHPYSVSRRRSFHLHPSPIPLPDFPPEKVSVSLRTEKFLIPMIPVMTTMTTTTTISLPSARS